ncbi:hypothetical protein GCM10007167_21210 [Vulcaniibacterium thermophilum]|uniref:Uncharacterized protein n=1 Tax=Vulcaniibacterium thermophilum TaxID=1169913 RepID=A0A919DET1_9GAMM|nr:hypothetical protein GCM10007167_21210 [Vulcaniibacterium thermophilum]
MCADLRAEAEKAARRAGDLLAELQQGELERTRRLRRQPGIDEGGHAPQLAREVGLRGGHRQGELVPQPAACIVYSIMAPRRGRTAPARCYICRNRCR